VISFRSQNQKTEKSLDQTNNKSNKRTKGKGSTINMTRRFDSNSNNSTSSQEEIEVQVHEFRASDPELMHEATMLAVNASGNSNNQPQQQTKAPTAPPASSCPFRYVPMEMGGRGGTHRPSMGSRELLTNEVTLADLETMTSKFYELAFQDDTLDKFIHSHSDPHGSRFAKWIYQKLTGEPLWDEDRQTRDLTPRKLAGGGGRSSIVVQDRTSAHVAAWHSPKRPTREVGRHFTLEECRVWMRLHFWAMRGTGIVDRSPSFADYYVRFIGHFVSVYEGSATMFARESFRWSGDPANIATYIQNGRVMQDVLGRSHGDAIGDLPEQEMMDHGWPYRVRV
jgi:hypothetical protein